MAIYPVPGTVSFTLRRVTLVDGKAPCPPPLKTDDDGASMVVGTADHLLFDEFFTQTRNNLELHVHPPVKSGLILTPEYPWEPMMFAFNSLIKVNESDYRIYYDVIGAAPVSVDPSGQNGYLANYCS